MATWGYSLRRNNSCKTDENDCGLTWSTWHSCCPESSTCPTNPSRNNGVCCPYAGDGCSKFVTTSDPQCPEESANVFQNLELNATICCSNDTMGFYVEKLGFVGCAKDMALAASSNGKDQVRMMNILSPSTTSSTTTSTTSTNSASTGVTSKGHHSTNTGAIAGGVVGGVCGAILLLGLGWWLLRRRKKTKHDNNDPQEDAQVADERAQGLRSELDNQSALRELDAKNDANPVREMDAGQDALRAKELEDPKGGIMKVLPELDDQNRPAAAELPS